MSTQTTSTYADRLSRERGHFDALAETTGESWWGHTTRAGARRLHRRAAILTERLDVLGEADVLEIGCGTGALTVELLKSSPSVRLTAGDLSERSVELAREKCRAFSNVGFETQDATQLNHDDESFDAVVGNSILHHVPVEPALGEIFRVLRRGGLVLFFEPNLMNPQLALETGLFRRWTPQCLQYSDDERPFVRWSLRRMIARAGFTSATVEPMDFLHPLVPGPLAPLVDHLGRVAERVPLVREISGSLLISAVKPAGTSSDSTRRGRDGDHSRGSVSIR